MGCGTASFSAGFALQRLGVQQRKFGTCYGKKSCTSWATSGIPTGWESLVISWFITRMKYRYIYYKPKLLELCAPTWRTIWHHLVWNMGKFHGNRMGYWPSTNWCRIAHPQYLQVQSLQTYLGYFGMTNAAALNFFLGLGSIEAQTKKTRCLPACDQNFNQNFQSSTRISGVVLNFDITQLVATKSQQNLGTNPRLCFQRFPFLEP